MWCTAYKSGKFVNICCESKQKSTIYEITFYSKTFPRLTNIYNGKNGNNTRMKRADVMLQSSKINNQIEIVKKNGKRLRFVLFNNLANFSELPQPVPLTSQCYQQLDLFHFHYDYSR